MRLLNIMLTKAKGGDGLMARHYHDALTAEGYEVLSIGHPDGMLSDMLGFRPLNNRFISDPICALRLAGYARSFRPDLIIAHGNRAGRACLLPFIGTRQRTVQVLHTPSYKPHLKDLSGALCVSGRVREGAETRFPELRLFDVANFSHLRALPVKSKPNSVPVIGAMGRLHSIKGFDLLLEACVELRAAGQRFELRIAGDGPERTSLEALTRQLRLEDHVRFCGWAEDPLTFLHGVDLFVVPSREESFGLVVIEALAAGVPVVASDTEGPREVLRGGQFGALFPKENTTALAQALGGVLDNGMQWLRRAREAQAYAIDSFGFEAGRRRLRRTVEALA
ncbi:glycosyltransferase [Asticcacaulis excentricus]|uniref:Glycosyl transferase group 1 n=1 Tax=Asticcacaulis excentricus (strain ATCC 15261 / DSM 4724 / KCTC 12464 / NCIMB 9791 / VKM B-1370 / CB 48) TaxID=573065 RepID=E8RUD9_ASTEC|nr:glycosyltransferase [Asticcacaulis excentricus]ADU15110.1 glycosyl transferase group 1 [Asticcacaulis excentricus CB 48]